MSSHEQRINNELKVAGVTPYGMRKFAIKYIPKIIHEDEHIKGIIYGRYGDKKGNINLNEGTLIATDRKIIFLDHKPGYTEAKEVAYDVVSGIKKTTAVFSSVTLYTRLGDFNLRFANPKCATIFVDYIERRRLENKRNL